MTQYMIHAMPKRMWYVQEFLIPSMIQQGIPAHDIKVYNDEKGEGNLRACMNAFKQVSTHNEGTWHLQDDVIISHDFKDKTETYDTGIVCGFNSMYDETLPSGEVVFENMWFSFPCIRIPNQIARECADWVLTYMIGNPVYKYYWEAGVNDDWMFRYFVKDHYKNVPILNLDPNIVDHIDYLIGGTVNSSKRSIQIRSKRWKDEYLVTKLAEQLNARR